MKFMALMAGSIMAMATLHARALEASAPAEPTVEISKFAFAPKEVTIKPGTKIIWTNKDETPHTVTSADKQLKSSALDTNDKFEHVFATEGDFSYFCTLHPFMTGVVHVKK